MADEAFSHQQEAPTVAVAAYRGADLGEFLRQFGGLDLGWTGSLYNWAAHQYDREELTDAERQEAWLFASIDLRLKSVSLARPRFYDGDTDEASEITSGPVVDLFSRPNPYLDGATLQICDAQNMILSGESFWFLQDRKGEPVTPIGSGPDPRIDLPTTIWPVIGSLVQLKLNREQTAPEAWEAPQLGGKRAIYPDGSVETFFDRPDKRRPFRGSGPMEAAWGAAAQNWLARRFSSKVLKNDGKVGGVIVLGGPVADHERRRLEREIEDRWDNPEKAAGTRLLAGDAKYQQANQSPRDLEYGELLKTNKLDISAVLQTPGALLGLDTSNYATFAGHFRRYITLCLEPWFDSRARYLNARFFPRLRQPGLARIRVRYDLERLWRIVGDLTEQSGTARQLTSIGVPLDDALTRSGIKTDRPIPGGAVGMVNASQIPLVSAQERGRALALEARAKAAQALQLAGVDAQESLDLAEIEATAVEPEKPEEPAPGAAPAEDGEDEDPEEEAALPRSAHEVPALPAGARTAAPVRASRAAGADPAATPAGRRIAWRAAEAVHGPLRRQADRALKAVLFRMRKAQLRALADVAEHGFVPRAFRVYPSPPPRAFAGATAAALLEAVARDREAAQERAEDAPLESPRTDAWVRAHPFQVRRWGLARLIDLARLSVLRISEPEIDAILVVGERRWRDELAKRLTPLTLKAYERAGEAMIEELGLLPRAINPDVLEALAAKTIRAVEGAQSVLARRLRTTLLRTMAENEPIGGFGGIQAAVKNLLQELKASTTAAFRTTSARALAIARTEVGGAANISRFEQIRDLYAQGVLSGYRWVTAGDGPKPGGQTRDSHWALDGIESTPDIGFVSGLGNHAFHPHGFSEAEETVNCRCTISGIVAETPAEVEA